MNSNAITKEILHIIHANVRSPHHSAILASINDHVPRHATDSHILRAYHHGLSLPTPDLAVAVAAVITISVVLPSDVGARAALSETDEVLFSPDADVLLELVIVMQVGEGTWSLTPCPLLTFPGSALCTLSAAHCTVLVVVVTKV